MQKTIKKPIVFLPLLVLFIITSLSANKTMFPTGEGLTSEIKATAIQFQNLRGSTRIAEFQKLYTAVFSKNLSTGSNEITADLQTKANYTFSDIEKILGPPDTMLSNGNWVYYLNANQQGCKVILREDLLSKKIYCNTYINM